MGGKNEDFDIGFDTDFRRLDTDLPERYRGIFWGIKLGQFFDFYCHFDFDFFDTKSHKAFTESHKEGFDTDFRGLDTDLHGEVLWDFLGY